MTRSVGKLHKVTRTLSYLAPQVWTKASNAASASPLRLGHLQRALGFCFLSLRQLVATLATPASGGLRSNSGLYTAAETTASASARQGSSPLA